MTGGSLGKGTLLAMSITPYINASIIIQLLAVAIPPLEKLQKEGEQGRKKLNTITKITSLAIAVLQAISFYIMLRNGTTVGEQHVAVLKYGDVNQVNPDMFSVVLSAIVIVACFVAGASMIIWLGDRINEKGIGNGISMILFAGIISGLPSAVQYFVTIVRDEPANIGLRAAGTRNLHRYGMVRHHDDQRREKDSGPVRKARCRQKDVRRSVLSHPDKGCDVRRYAYHLCNVPDELTADDPLLLRYHRAERRLLGRIPPVLQPGYSPVCGHLLPAHHRIQLLLCIYPVQSC